MAGSKRSKGGAPVEFRSQALAEALERQDMAAVALALRHGNTVVPLIKPGPRDAPLDGGEVWTYRDPRTGEVALLLFSDALNKPANLPPAVGLQSPAWLRTFLKRYESTITTVFLDIAGPHPMQASPAELLKALEA
ncbi:MULTISPECIES: dehydrogenase [unclassified Agromyces]|uniref:dehydrogenase n=1 Tax=unclassified Agromyces TaxID=2639701 RepID=UPI00301560EB